MSTADRSRTMGVLYAEDFDDPPPVVAPEPPPVPMFDAAALQAARQAAHTEGVAAGEAQAAQRQRQATATALAAIAAAMGDADAAATREAEGCADALAGLLLACLHRALPETCRRHGAAEAQAVARAVLPGLRHEPQVTVRADPATAAAVAAEITAHEPDLTARLRVQPTPEMAPGDVRIAWADGYTQRDVAALWQAIAEALRPAGLNLPTTLAPTTLAPEAADPAAPGPTESPVTPTASDRASEAAATAARAVDNKPADTQTRELEHAG